MNLIPSRRRISLLHIFNPLNYSITTLQSQLRYKTKEISLDESENYVSKKFRRYPRLTNIHKYNFFARRWMGIGMGKPLVAISRFKNFFKAVSGFLKVGKFGVIEHC